MAHNEPEFVYSIAMTEPPKPPGSPRSAKKVDPRFAEETRTPRLMIRFPCFCLLQNGVSEIYRNDGTVASKSSARIDALFHSLRFHVVMLVSKFPSPGNLFHVLGPLVCVEPCASINHSSSCEPCSVSERTVPAHLHRNCLCSPFLLVCTSGERKFYLTLTFVKDFRPLLVATSQSLAQGE
uniref:Uncharacterized protein n=1 Tax=Physcomitrium patens TaxID=3218 RepID=A0A7I4CNS2_PHYPA